MAKTRSRKAHARRAETPVTVERYKFTPEAFHRLGALGFLDDTRPYELIEGDIYAIR